MPFVLLFLQLLLDAFDLDAKLGLRGLAGLTFVERALHIDEGELHLGSCGCCGEKCQKRHSDHQPISHLNRNPP
jgi:hypothetical protein